jgi:hypothetical protein
VPSRSRSGWGVLEVGDLTGLLADLAEGHLSIEGEGESISYAVRPQFNALAVISSSPTGVEFPANALRHL